MLKTAYMMMMRLLAMAMDGIGLPSHPMSARNAYDKHIRMQTRAFVSTR